MKKIVCIAGIALLMVGVAQANLASNLVAYYDFETDLSNQAGALYDGSTVNGPWTTGATATGPGFTGNAAYVIGDGLSDRGTMLVGNALNIYDGHDTTVSVPLGTAQLGQTFSISAWTYLAPGAGNGSARFHAFEAGNNWDVSWGTLDGNTSLMQSYVAQVKLSPDIAITHEQWQHVVQVFTSDGATTTLDVYIDGVTTPAASGTALTSAMNFTGINIGDARVGASGDRQWDGMIDEFAVWNRALTTTEVTELYDLGVAGQAIPVPATQTEPFSRLLIDFGLYTEETASPGFFGRYWNNISVAANQTQTTGTLSRIYNIDGTTAAGVTVQITDALYKSSANNAGGEQIYTPDATTDMIYIRKEDNNLGKLKITGLDPSAEKVYDFKFFVTSNRSLPEKYITDYTVAGATTNTVSFNVIGNVNGVASVDGMTANASGELEVTISINPDSDTYGSISVMEVIARAPADPVTPDPEPVEYSAVVPPGAWTIALMPDTQYYVRDNPGVFSAQTIWLRDNIKKYNIQCALQLGDLTDDNIPEQWKSARESLGVLDGHLDYFFCPGNHDFGPGGNTTTRDTGLNTYFDYADYSTRNHFGGAMESNKLENTYHTFKAGGYDWIVLCATFGVPDTVVAWANGVLAAHPDHKAILITHAYMYYDDTRYDWAAKGTDQSANPHNYSVPGDVNDGQELWDELIKSNNFVLTLNGHVLGDGTGFRTDANLTGQNVHQMLCNYQSPIVSDLGGGGWLRLLTVNPNGTVQVKSYSPIYNAWNTAGDQEFNFGFEWYAPADTNSNGVADYYDSELDSDGDGLNNYEEFTTLGTGPFETDSDGDGIDDGLENRIGTDPSVSDKETAQAILNHSDDFGYYSEQEIIDLNIGYLLIFPDGTNFTLNLQLETTDDLATTPFADKGEPIQWSIPSSTSNKFMRIRAEP
jgi:hypothetical protein